MQIVVAVPEFANLADAEAIMRHICGVPLLERTLKTAQRFGANDVLLIWPQSVPLELGESFLRIPTFRKTEKFRLVHTSFDPAVASSWINIDDCLESQFIWLPWNWVTNARALSDLPTCGRLIDSWTRPCRISKTAVLTDVKFASQTGPLPKGVAVTSDESAAEAERFLVAGSGKVLDGFHTSFNRRLCRPFVRLLSHTRVTPNQVTCGGVLVSIASFFAFAHGGYWAYVVGALLFFIAGLFDEMDGMLARIKFADSSFGTWFEGFADGLGYLLLFAGITIGLYRQHGDRELWVGAALLVGTVLSLIVTSLGRKRGTTADRRHEYLGTLYEKMEGDSSNWISRTARRIQPLQKRGVCIHYIVLLTVLGCLPVLFYLSTLGSHLMWTLSLYFNHRFFKQAKPVRELAMSQEAS